MDKDIVYNHSITLNERKSINITGVKKIDSFDDTEFLLETIMGNISIKGEELEIIKLDTYQGNVSIKGKINGLTYMESSGKKEKVDCLSCSDCMGHCVFCFASCPKAGGYKAHKSCYSDKKCVICKNKKGQFTVIGKCTKCGSKGSKYYNKCFICGELL